MQKVAASDNRVESLTAHVQQLKSQNSGSCSFINSKITENVVTVSQLLSPV